MYKYIFVNKKNNMTAEATEETKELAIVRLQELMSKVPKVEKGFIYQADVLNVATGETELSLVTKVRQLRLDMHMTQMEFSDYFNIPKRTIENWESGIATPPGYVIKMLEILVRNNIRPD